MARDWFAYIGEGNPLLPENYIISFDTPACRSGFSICAIYAADSAGSSPSVISANMRQYIANGLTNGVPEPRLPLAAKKYVYMRTGN